jgi:hypothetical protein
VHTSLVAALKTLFSRGFLTLRLRQGCRGHRRSCCRPQGFREELQVLRSESRNRRSIDVPDILGARPSADLRDVAWLATVEAETMMRVSLHRMGAIQVHGLGTEDAAGAEGREEEGEDEVATVETMAGGGRDENVRFVAALGCVSRNLLH